MPIPPADGNFSETHLSPVIFFTKVIVLQLMENVIPLMLSYHFHHDVIL